MTTALWITIKIKTALILKHSVGKQIKTQLRNNTNSYLIFNTRLNKYNTFSSCTKSCDTQTRYFFPSVSLIVWVGINRCINIRFCDIGSYVKKLETQIKALKTSNLKINYQMPVLNISYYLDSRTPFYTMLLIVNKLTFIM